MNEGLPTSTQGWSIAIDPFTPQDIYLGTRDIGVFRRRVGGGGWHQVSERLGHAFISSVAVDPIEPRTVYCAVGALVYRSEDAGRTWSEASAGLPARDVGELFIDPFDTATIYFTTDVPGLFKSVDRGGHWRALTGGLTTSISDLVFDPLRRNVLYAATQNGVFTSRDGGRSWQPKSTGLGSEIVTTLAIDPSTPTTLYAGTFRGVYKSTNAGRTWALASSGVLATAIVVAIVIDPADPSRGLRRRAVCGLRLRFQD